MSELTSQELRELIAWIDDAVRKAPQRRYSDEQWANFLFGRVAAVSLLVETLKQEEAKAAKTTTTNTPRQK